ncbi:beta-1,6-N-acetylglucosaminyltransferase [Sphingomonas sp. M1-B02]|uniref:beta-1,6-N-acetylglucosaminyltransferase n=1 Tax=Sphingomonas sp. M1-B02 TaxID=3114300 RepID=UPI00223F6934|nr:beta-1,6-N-acetylglucosaminyltransferase [Sphingomonas sp. S6-11]UZK67748.1 beta-1,6-N-acetylglucosaminyltransferase [Sphingomonas sp. S6-11]
MDAGISIGFCILSHKDALQLLQLVNTLNEIYNFPPIACHHDITQSPIDVGHFPDNVVFVRPIKTGWARMSVVLAGLRTISALFDRFRPDWFVLLSATDYPVSSASSLRNLLTSTECDTFIDARPLLIQNDSVITTVGSLNPALDHFGSAANFRLKQRFYLSPEWWVPILRFKPRLRIGRFTVRWPWISRPVRSSRLNFYYGDHWFMGNARTAEALGKDSLTRRFLMKHLAKRTTVDECFYQTMIMSSSDLTVCIDNHRFAEWNGGGAHPMELTAEQIPEIRASGAFFARKFAKSSDAIVLIHKQLLDLPPPINVQSNPPVPDNGGVQI